MLPLVMQWEYPVGTSNFLLTNSPIFCESGPTSFSYDLPKEDEWQEYIIHVRNCSFLLLLTHLF